MLLDRTSPLPNRPRVLTLRARPKLISDEGLKWRRRIYACAAYFAMALAIAFLAHRGG